MSGGLQPLLFNQAAPVPITQALKPYQHRSAQALPKLPSLATPWVELGYTLGRVCEICSEHYTCRLACPRLNDSGSKENLRHNCATIVRVLRHNCQSTAPQLFRSCPAKPHKPLFFLLFGGNIFRAKRKKFSNEEEEIWHKSLATGCYFIKNGRISKKSGPQMLQHAFFV